MKKYLILLNIIFMGALFQPVKLQSISLKTIGYSALLLAPHAYLYSQKISKEELAKATLAGLAAIIAVRFLPTLIMFCRVETINCVNFGDIRNAWANHGHRPWFVVSILLAVKGSWHLTEKEIIDDRNNKKDQPPPGKIEKFVVAKIKDKLAFID